MSTKAEPTFTIRLNEQERKDFEDLKTLYRVRSQAEAVRLAVRQALIAGGTPYGRV